MAKLSSKLDNYRKTEKTNLEKYYGSIDTEGEHILFRIFGNDLKIKRQLGFVKILKKAKKYVLGKKVVHVRDEYLCQSLDEFLKEVDKGRYKATDFWEYMCEKSPG